MIRRPKEEWKIFENTHEAIIDNKTWELMQEQPDKSSGEQRKEIAKKRRELAKSEKRIAELDVLFQQIYEDNVVNKLSKKP